VQELCSLYIQLILNMSLDFVLGKTCIDREFIRKQQVKL
jgi:hypothetical protein